MAGIHDTSFDFRRETPKEIAPVPSSETTSKDTVVSGSLSYTLHPLVVINISDHHTRVNAQHGADTPKGGLRVFGVLLGIQTGRRVDVANSFEIKASRTATGDFEPDHGFLRTRLEQYKKTFPNYEMIGWYSTGADVQPNDMTFHQQMCEVNEGFLYLVLDPVQALCQGNRELPIALHESELHVFDDKPTITFSKVSYKIDSVESERIAVDHVAHILPSGDSNSGSALAQHLGTQYTAISVLSERIDVIQKYLKAVSSDDVPADHELLRQIKSLCSRLPALDSTRFTEEFLCDTNNTLLVFYMSCITKGTGSINDIIEKYNTAYDKHSRRRGMF